MIPPTNSRGEVVPSTWDIPKKKHSSAVLIHPTEILVHVSFRSISYSHTVSRQEHIEIKFLILKNNIELYLVVYAIDNNMTKRPRQHLRLCASFSFVLKLTATL